MSADPVEKVRARFESETAEHVLTVVRDDGVYRHLRCQKPGTYVYGFDIVTWPGYLAICGDMGERMFTRTEDMLSFFDSSSFSYDYWAEKVRPGGTRSCKEFSPDVYQQRVLQWVAEQREEMEPDAAAALMEAAASLIRMDLDESRAHQLLYDFEHRGITISESYEWDLTEFESQYLWQCMAIVWAVQQYRSLKAAVPA